jgi:hypothetical protein
MRTVRREQHRRHRDRAAAQERPGPQRVAAVVAGADQQRHPPARGPAGQLAQHRCGLDSQPERGLPHQRAVRGSPQQPVLGGPDLLGRPDPQHGYSTVTDFARLRGLSTS